MGISEVPGADLGILIGGFFFRECISNNHLTGGNFHLKVGRGGPKAVVMLVTLC